MKKIITLILVAVMLLLAVGCSDSSYSSGGGFTGNYNDNDDNSETNSNEVNETVSFAQAGIYSFFNSSSGQYLSASGNSLILSSNPYDWKISLKEDNKVYVYTTQSDLLFDVDNAYVAEGTTIKLWQNTGYEVQLWKVLKNKNGSYSFICSVDERYCLGFLNGKAVLQLRDENNAMQEWILNDTASKYYKKIVGTKGVIELQLPLDINRVITDSRLQKWANDLETAYFTFKELTNYQPYERVVVEAYKPCEYIGYVLNNCNIIHIDKEFIYGDLEKMSKRNNDWNFCALHEMGHMFDNYRPWDFETEMMTDLKLVYVLEINGAAATPSEYDASYNFVGKDVVKAYEGLKSDFSSSYNIYGCAHRFVKIKEEVGWEPFKQTFYKMQSEYNTYANMTKRQKFDSFVSLLNGYSGKDIKSYFTANEWNTILKKLNG